MKNYAVLDPDVFLYDLLADGRICDDVYTLCKKGQLKLIYNENILEDFKCIFENCVPNEKKRFLNSIEKIKSFGIEADVEDIKKDPNSILYKIVPSTHLYKDTSPEANNGFNILCVFEIPKEI